MTARVLWVAANVVNVITLAMIMWGFRQRLVNATAVVAPGVVLMPSVIAQRRLNATSARAHLAFYAGLMVLGLVMIAGALSWDYFVDGPVPGVIPGGTLIFTVVYFGKALFNLWESRQRERVVAMAQDEVVGC